MHRREHLYPTPVSRDWRSTPTPNALKRKDGKLRFDSLPPFVEYILEDRWGGKK